MTPACTRAILTALSLRNFVFDVCVCIFLFVDLTRKKGLYIKKSFEMCICSEFDRPEMTVRLSGRSIPTTTSWPASFKFHSQDLRN